MPAATPVYHRDDRDFFSLPAQDVRSWYDRAILPYSSQEEGEPGASCDTFSEFTNALLGRPILWDQNPVAEQQHNNSYPVPRGSRASQELSEYTTSGSYPRWITPHRPRSIDTHVLEQYRLTFRPPYPEYIGHPGRLPWSNYEFDDRTSCGVIDFAGGAELVFQDPLQVPLGIWLGSNRYAQEIYESELVEYLRLVDPSGRFCQREPEEFRIRPTANEMYRPTPIHRYAIVGLELPTHLVNQFRHPHIYFIMEA